jgi:protein subunit release factor B
MAKINWKPRDNVVKCLDEFEDITKQAEALKKQMGKIEAEAISKYAQFQTQLNELLTPLKLKFRVIKTQAKQKTSISEGRMYIVADEDSVKEMLDSIDIEDFGEHEFKRLDTDNFLFIYFEEKMDSSYKEFMNYFKNSNAIEEIEIALTNM